MRIVIVDDYGWIVKHMVDIAEQAGQEVLGVHIGESPNPKYAALDGIDKHLHTTDLDEAAAAIRAFDPDLVFLDHDLGIGEMDGEVLAEKIGLPQEKYVAMSSAYTQEYCGRRIHFDKKMLKERPSAREAFVSFFTAN